MGVGVARRGGVARPGRGAARRLRLLARDSPPPPAYARPQASPPQFRVETQYVPCPHFSPSTAPGRITKEQHVSIRAVLNEHDALMFEIELDGVRGQDAAMVRAMALFHELAKISVTAKVGSCFECCSVARMGSADYDREAYSHHYVLLHTGASSTTSTAPRSSRRPSRRAS